MVNVQQWLDENYPREMRGDVCFLNIDGKELEGKLELKEFNSLRRIDCNFNQLTELKIASCPELTGIYCYENELTNLRIINCPNVSHLNVSYNLFESLDFLNSLDPKKLLYLSVHTNNFFWQDLTCFIKFSNLEELYIDNSYEKKIVENIYNRFYGSLEPLKNLKKLRFLNISDTNIDSGLQYLPESLKKIGCDSTTEKKCLKIKKELEKSSQIEGVSEKLIKFEESDTKWSKCWYRIYPWHQAQELLLEKNPSVKVLKKEIGKLQKQIYFLADELREIKEKIGQLEEQINFLKTNKRGEIKPRNILLIGQAGNGKSTLANVITRTDKFKKDWYLNSRNQDIQIEEVEINGINYRIIDTVGFGGSNSRKLSDEVIIETISKILQTIEDDFYQILFVIGEKFRKEEIDAYKKLKAKFQNIEKYTTIIRTKFTRFENPEECFVDTKMIKSDSEDALMIIKKCNKIIHVDNIPMKNHYIKIAPVLHEESRKRLIVHLRACWNVCHSAKIGEEIVKLNDNNKEIQMQQEVSKKTEY